MFLRKIKFMGEFGAAESGPSRPILAKTPE